jgi:branched-chain amino acid transport system substrate-binding protein
MKKFALCLVIALVAAGLLSACVVPTPPPQEATIKIGINAPLTGDIPKVGEGTKFSAEMWLEDINAAGGLEVGGKKYPNTTLDRPWVFRTPFLDPFQGPVLANFVTDEFGFTKAAVLYDVASDYPKGLADFFKQGWEDVHGPDSVVAFESFTTGDTDFSAQLTKIKESGAEFIFTPQYYNEVALIVQQAHELGWDAPIVGSDSWGSAELMNLCGDECKGLFFSTHYAAKGATGATKEFIDRYNEEHGYVPDDVGALTWDTMHIVQKAIQDCGEITGDIAAGGQCVRDALAQIKEFPGITGDMTFTEEGDPIKCAVIVKISDEGEFEFYQQVCP